MNDITKMSRDDFRGYIMQNYGDVSESDPRFRDLVEDWTIYLSNQGEMSSRDQRILARLRLKLTELIQERL
jgi:hypothetical protein